LTGKPTLLMAHLVSIVPTGGIILDPFAGSGMTLVAARKSGRQYVGSEKEKEYWQIAMDRLTA
jgi:site-specific DNA-methyltransferase (adenine-specific)